MFLPESSCVYITSFRCAAPLVFLAKYHFAFFFNPGWSFSPILGCVGIEVQVQLCVGEDVPPPPHTHSRYMGGTSPPLIFNNTKVHVAMSSI